jgi:formylglycine-generating enzyme required for sulfatase activity
MQHLRNLIRLLIILSLIFFIASTVSALTRGIHVVSKKGKELYLYKDYHALVVGVSNYDKWPDLPNAVKDAKEVSSALKRLGFKVKQVYNPTSRELTKALNDLTYKQGREKNRAILFYFAGHGETETLADGTKLGYIIPKDCPLIKDDPHGFINHAVSMKDIETYSLRIRSKHVLALFDSCFSGSLFSLGRAVPEDICEKSAFPVRQYITAGNEDETVPDRSMFKRCLILGLEGDADLTRDGYITGSELGMYLSDKVVQFTSRAQHPQYGKINIPELSRGDFIIKLASSGVAIEEPAPTINKATLSVKCNISGARVIIDNRDARNTPVTDMELSPGEHRIRVEKNGYGAYKKRIRLKEGRSLNITAYLDKTQPRTGNLYVDTDPDDARVRILNIGPKYYRGIELAPGQYHIEVSASDYETKKQWIDLTTGEDKYIDVRLVKQKVAVAGKTFTNSIGMKFVLIHDGTFMMGSPSSEPERDSDERRYKITLTKGFYMGVTEVTQKQWRSIMGHNPSRFKGHNRPVEKVSWNDAKEFIRKLNQKEGTNKYRLPTEAEWEYACRAGTTTPFYTGNCISTDQANYDGNYPMPGCSKGRYRKETVRVGSFSPNAWGLYDMHGNVYEWCEDRYDKSYPNRHVTDPKGPSSGSDRVLRGGSWLNHAWLIRSALRLRHNPDYGLNHNGFRVVRTY